MTRLERRHEEAVTAALGAGGAARSSVVASWMRSARHHGLAPSLRPRDERMTQAELAQIRARMEPVLVSAQPTLDRLFGVMGSFGACVVLASDTGVPVERRGKASEDGDFAGRGCGQVRCGRNRRWGPTASAPASPRAGQW